MIRASMSSYEQTTSEAVLAAVAERRGIDETKLERPIYDAVDPDALDSLFRSGAGEVTFRYLGYRVTVDADRNVDLAPARPEKPAVR